MSPPKLIVWRRSLLPLGWMALIFWLSSRPAEQLEVLPPLFPGADKFVHAALFGILLACFRFVFVGSAPASRWVLPCLVVTVLYAATDEIHQSYVPGREPDWYDFLADATGALLSTCGLIWYRNSRVRAAQLASRAQTPGE